MWSNKEYVSDNLKEAISDIDYLLDYIKDNQNNIDLFEIAEKLFKIKFSLEWNIDNIKFLL